MSETVIAASLKLDASQATTSVKSFRTQLREAQQSLVGIQERFGDASTEALAAARSVAQLRDRISDAREVSDLFNPAQRFQAFGNAVRAATGGVTALTGAMALFGDQSEDVQQALLKVQGALALTEGLNTLGNAAEDFSRLKAIALDTFKAIKTAIGTTGIGLLVVALGLIVTYWDDIKNAVGLANSSQLEAVNTTQKQYDIEKGKLELLSSQNNILKEQGVSEQHILDLQNAQLEVTIKAGEKALAAQKVITDQATASTTAWGAGLRAALNAFAPSGTSTGIADFLFDPNKTRDAGEKTLLAAKEELTKLKDQKAANDLALLKSANDFNQKILDFNHAAAEAGITDQYLLNKRKAQDALAAATAQAAIDYTNIEQRNAVISGLQNKFDAEQAAAQKAHHRQLQDDLRKIAFDGKTANITDQVTLSQLQIRFQLDNDIRQANLEIANVADKNDKIAALQKTADEKLAAIRNKFLVDTFDKLQKIRLEKAQEEEDSERKRLEELAKKQSDLETEALNQSNDIDASRLDAAGQAAYAQLKTLKDSYDQRRALIIGDQAAEKKLLMDFEQQKTKITQIQNEARLKLVSQVLGNAAALFEKNTIAYKAFAISQTIIDTYASAVSSYRSLAGIPIVGPALGFAAAAVAVASGLANVQRILSVDTSGSDTSAPSGGGAQSAPLQQSPQVGSTQLPQSQLNQINNAANPVRAFVIESDVTNNQERIKRLNRAAKLGG